MKLTPKQVKLVYPFLPGITSRVLRFTGRRNTVHLQETALVLEGELIRFHYLGLERLFARALAEWTTITIPYSRLIRVKYKSRRFLRLFVVLSFVLIIGLLSFGLFSRHASNPELTILLLSGGGPILGLLCWVMFRAILPGFAVTFRARDGTKTRFLFQVKKKPHRKEFGERLREYRAAAKAFVVPGQENRV
ncbi:MAG TPA: hypothetical protein VGJ05_21280 [Fimbriiglobus sp.]